MGSHKVKTILFIVASLGCILSALVFFGILTNSGLVILVGRALEPFAIIFFISFITAFICGILLITERPSRK